MHELSLASNLVQQVSDAARRAGATRVLVVRVAVGALSGVASDALRFAYDIATQQTLLEGSRLEICDVPVTIHCTHCQHEVALVDIQCFACPTCGTPSHDVRTGRELRVETIEIEDSEEQPST